MKDQEKQSASKRKVDENISKVLDIEETQRKDRNFGEKVSEWIARFAGSMTFVYLHVVWFGGWIVANIIFKPFDPFPFAFLILLVTLELIFLSTFILINQNQEARLTERRNHLDLQINLLAEQENTKMLELLKAIAEKVGVDYEDDGLTELLKSVDPEKMINEIVESSAREKPTPSN